jgi:hypothetical protein
MTCTSLVAAAVVVLGIHPLYAPLPNVSPDPAAAVVGKLRWVRATVTSVSADSLTLRLRDKDLTITRDGVEAPAVGSTVEAHYLDKSGAKRAVLIFELEPTTELSKRAGYSYRGLIKRLKRSSVSVAAGTKSNTINLMKKTRLVDAAGRAVAAGAKEVGALLRTGDEVLIKYEEDSAVVVEGMMMGSGSDQALEVRKLR